MKVAHQHLTDSQLQAFAQGEMDIDQFGQAEEHLASCDACCQRLAGQPENTLLSLARAAMTINGQAHMRQQMAATIPSDLAEHPRYRILESIGVGGMGAVFKAEHRLMQRVVALKLVHPWLLSNPQAVERFEREVRLAARLSHPNIVVAYDADRTEQRHFLVMEYVEGQTLQDKIARHGPASVQQARDWILQAAMGLQHAHAQGMTHRDIKPQNLMITSDGRLRILDFGLSRVSTESTSSTPVAPASAPGPQRTAIRAGSTVSANLDALTTGETSCCRLTRTDASTILGTPDYIAPEQIDSSATVDIRADIYSLGCTLYYLLTGLTPFRSTSVASILQGHQSLPFPDIRSVRSDIPEDVALVLARMTAKQPSARYATPADVVRALEATIPSSATQVTGSHSSAWRASRRRVLGIAALAGGAALVAGLAPFLAIKRPQRLLVIMPSDGLWYPDYQQLLASANEHPHEVQLVFASPAQRPSNVFSTSKPGVAVPDVQLTSELRADAFDGLIFIGYVTSEFQVDSGAMGDEVSRLINEFQMQKKTLGGLCAGQRILAQHGALRGKHVAACESVRNEEIEVEGGIRTREDVVADGLVITASSADHAQEFIKKILQAKVR